MFHHIISITQLIFTQLNKVCSIALSSIILLAVPNSFASQPDWILSGTFLSAENSHAMFVDDSGDELLLELGDEIRGCALVAVNQNSAKLRCTQKDYSMPIRSSVGDVLLQAEHERLLSQRHTVILSEAEVAEYIQDKQRLVTEIGFLPLVEDEKVVGYTLSKIKPDTKAAELGLYNGDIIKSINGVSATESDLFMMTLRELSDAPEITLEVDRYGKRIAYTYIIE